MKKHIIGIDLSKDKIDFCILNSLTFKIISKGEVKNELKSLSKWVNSQDLESTSFSMEHTGHYGASLSWLLSERKAQFFILNPLDLKQSLGVQRGKTDVVDAFRIASYTITHKHKLSPFNLPCEEIRKLKVLMTSREKHVKISVQLQNSLKANLILAKTIDIKDLIKDEKKLLKSVKKSISDIDKQIKLLIKNTEEINETYQKIGAVIGVGPITAIKCIIETDNFLRFKNGRKFNCHCGLAPFPYQSGSSIKGKTKTSQLRNKSMKATLFRAAGSAIQHDPQLKKYYQRKVDEGKHKLSALNAVASKLVLRIFAVANREQPFVKLTA